MNAQDFRSLQEAYLEVVSNNNELSEAKIDDGLSGQQKKDIRNKRSKFGDSSLSKSKKTELRHYVHNRLRGIKKVSGDKSAEKEIAVMLSSQRMHGILPKIQKVGGTKGLPEQVDLYDIILSHLLDEGYATTQEAAEVIMVNMSEEWRDDIVEAILEYQPFKGKRKKVKQKVKELEKKQSTNPQDLGFGNERLRRRIASMKKVLSKSNKEIKSDSELKSYENSARGGFRHDPQSKYYVGD